MRILSHSLEDLFLWSKKDLKIHPRQNIAGVCYFIRYMQERTFIGDLGAHIGEQVSMSGWVDVRRDQGKMVFFDMRDMTGKVQCVTLQSLGEGMDSAKEMRPEWVLKVYGIVKKRPDKNINKEVWRYLDITSSSKERHGWKESN